jgi:hypothetical protein
MSVTTAASTTDPPAGGVQKAHLGLLYALVAAAAAVAVALNAISDITVTVRSDDFIVFAVLYILAQATERLVEPLMATSIAPQADESKKELGKAKTELALGSAAAGATAAADDPPAADVANKQAALTELQKQRARVGWALSSGFALVICGLLGLGLIGSVSTVTPDDGNWNSVFSAVDVVVTGLAVGAGTKPLHDLITRIEKSKEKADPATDPAVSPAG